MSAKRLTMPMTRTNPKTRRTNQGTRDHALQGQAGHHGVNTIPAHNLPQASEHRRNPSATRQAPVAIIRPLPDNNGIVWRTLRATGRVARPITRMIQGGIGHSQARKKGQERTKGARPILRSSQTTAWDRLLNVRPGLGHNPPCTRSKSLTERRG